MAQITLSMKIVSDFFRKNWIIVLILLVGTFFRLYKIDQYMTFLGDEGRDVIIVRNLLVKADPILIGPGTSVGGMYLGPLYYYFMAPFLLLSNFSPVGPSVGVALLGVLTIYLLYIAVSDWLGKRAGIISALLFAISPTVITYSHSSWNPNIMPFFALLSVYSIWRAWKLKDQKWLIVTAISFAFVLNSHYLGVFLLPLLVIFWYLSKVSWKYTLTSLLVFSFLMSPLLIFDVRHDWMNSRALYKFLTERNGTLSNTPTSSIAKFYPTFEQINGSMLTAKKPFVSKVVAILILSYLAFAFTDKNKNLKKKYLIPLLWFVFGLVGLGLYNQEIYDHYFGFLFPVPFILIAGFFADRLEKGSKLMSLTVYGLIIYLVVLNLSNNPLRFNPNNQMKRAQNVSSKVLEIAEGKPFNLAVLAERNYEDGYRYFMELENVQVMHADRWDQKTIVENLIVICEKQKEKCDPTHSPKAEVANFGMSKIVSDFEVDGVIIYKLIHSK